MKGVLIMTDSAYIRKGDIFYVELGTNRNGHIQNGGITGVRPCIIMNNNIACKVSPTLLVVPITSSGIKRSKNMPTHLLLENVVQKQSVATFEQVLTVNRYQLRNKIGNLPDTLMQEADEKIKIAFGLVPQFA